jgi:hypothetical protein
MESDYTASSGLEVKRLDARPALVASPRGAQLHGDPAARPARGSGQERHRPGEVSCCRHVRRVWRRKLTARVNVPRPSRGGGSGRSRCPSSPPDETTRVRRTSALGGGRACAVERSSGRAVGQTAGSAQHSALRWSGPPDGCGSPRSSSALPQVLPLFGQAPKTGILKWRRRVPTPSVVGTSRARSRARRPCRVRRASRRCSPRGGRGRPPRQLPHAQRARSACASPAPSVHKRRASL